ncbi:hypothetical protein OIU41_06655 [Lacticaseibacillus paracasei]|uniref:hypothetical protein n=1 Tax=Lacticaseibacillus paracasei TaxID=1597 RepID=UPI0033991046
MPLKFNTHRGKTFHIAYFFVKYGPLLLAVLVIPITFIVSGCSFKKWVAGFHKVGFYLVSGNSQAITLATVLIGIYLTLYTLLLATDNDSIFCKISDRTFALINKLTVVGIVINTLFVLVSLLYPLIKENNGFATLACIWFYLIMANFFKVSTYYLLSIYEELKIRKQVIKDKAKAKVEQESLMKELKQFLKSKE